MLNYSYDEIVECYKLLWRLYKESFPEEARHADEKQRKTYIAMHADCASAGLDSADISPSAVADI